MKSNSKGIISIKKLLLPECLEEGIHPTSVVEESCRSFVETFCFQDLKAPTVELPVLLYIAGYVGKSARAKLACEVCRCCLGTKDPLEVELSDEASLHDYMHILNRGGLTYPSALLFDVIQAAYSIFCKCISERETGFVTLGDQKRTLTGLNQKFWELSGDFSLIHTQCGACDKSRVSVFTTCVASMSNILLNNYTRKRNDDIPYAQASKKRARKF